MTLSIGICDDMEPELLYIKSIVSDWAALRNLRAEVFAFPSAEAFMFEFGESNCPDILLLDVEMGKMNGVELAKKLRNAGHTSPIIFITGYPDFMAEGFDVSALHYLLKPVKPEKLAEVLDRAAAAASKAPRSLLLTVGGDTVRVSPDSILFAEATGHYVELHTLGETHRLRMTMSEAEKLLGDGFFRCSRSFVVSLEHVTRIAKSSVILSDGTELPISRGSREELNLKLIQYTRER